MIDTLKMLFERDLRKLKSEIESYKNDKNLWQVDTGIDNSGGNLCLHLIGNLNTYIGAELGKTGYVRNRELEFSQKNMDKEALLEMIENTISVVIASLDKVDKAELQNEYPIVVFEHKTSIEYFLIHLSMHLAYHLGQINYHRRLIDK